METNLDSSLKFLLLLLLATWLQKWQNIALYEMKYGAVYFKSKVTFVLLT